MSTYGPRSGTAKSTTGAGKTANRPQQARDKVRDMLITKLMGKFGKMPNAASIVSSKVTKFMQQSRVTEANLKKLEKEILDTINAKPAAAKPAPPPKESAKGLEQSRPVSSVSKKSEAPQVVASPSKDYEGISDVDPDSLLEKKKVPYNEDKEWDAILKFNNDLYKEELRQEEERKTQQKKLMKAELDKQLQEKRMITTKIHEEDHAYEGMQKTHLDIISAKDRERVLEQKKQKLTAKEMLDQQMKDEALRKRAQELQNKQYEKALVEKAKRELEAEKAAQQQKRDMEREYHKKMLEENEVNKKKQLEQEAFIKEQEKKDLAEYTKMLEQQDAERLEGIKGREKKTQELMNRMANTVIKELDKKKEADEQKMLKYQQEKELRDKMDDEERLRRIKEMQKEMRSHLDQQMNEKKGKAVMEKEENKRQAEVWKKELAMYQEEEKAIQRKMAVANKDHAEFLKMQMDSGKKGKKNVMNREEYLLNKKLLEEAEKKLGGGSSAADPLAVQDS